ncbi:CLUMA_CG009191, isoform A [Clunio marinus]|uniref:CLUMA_CG009191, isoform A n=1 Tax=Clunio marinus TaxID=568069 RepID=A0A1J1I9U1_9DIPT|nr:CLUMA_CG009191, isoform A [Clunio marinus]
MFHAESYQYQLQSMWQKCWNSQNLVQHMRFRERGPLKSWRPETMAEAIFSVLKEGLSLSQAARKYDIPYPTFVLYANRVHNMLGPSMDGGTDLRPKGRGRPQRILLGIWPDEHIKGVIKSVVFRDEKIIKDDPMIYGRQSPFPFQDSAIGYPNGLNQQTSSDTMSPDILAAVRQQMCNMVDAANFVAGFNLPPNMTIQSMTPPTVGSSSSNISNPKIGSPAISNLNKNGGEPSNILQMPRLASPAVHSLPSELSLHGLQNLSTNEEELYKKEKMRNKRENEGLSQIEGHQKSLSNNRLSITKLHSPKTLSKNLPTETHEPAANLVHSGQSLDMTFKSSRTSSDESFNGEDLSPRSYRGFKDCSPIKLEPLADCRD